MIIFSPTFQIGGEGSGGRGARQGARARAATPEQVAGPRQGQGLRAAKVAEQRQAQKEEEIQVPVAVQGQAQESVHLST